jgi:hypothetical protein
MPAEDYRDPHPSEYGGASQDRLSRLFSSW